MLHLALLLAAFLPIAASTPAPLPDRQAPAKFTVKLTTDVIISGERAPPVFINITRAWAPHAADRFYSLVHAMYYVASGFYRVVPDCCVQFGVAHSPDLTRTWDIPIPDDAQRQSNVEGTVAFVGSKGVNSRTTHVFVNLRENAADLDIQGYVPFGVVTSGLGTLRHVKNPNSVDPELYTKYGNSWFRSNYPLANLVQNITFVWQSLPEEAVVTVATPPDDSGMRIPIWTWVIAALAGALCMVLMLCCLLRWKCGALGAVFGSCLVACGLGNTAVARWLLRYSHMEEASCHGEDEVSETNDGDAMRIRHDVLEPGAGIVDGSYHSPAESFVEDRRAIQQRAYEVAKATSLRRHPETSRSAHSPHEAAEAQFKAGQADSGETEVQYPY